MEEGRDGSPRYIQNYSEVVRQLKPNDRIIFKTREGEKSFVVGPRGVLGGQTFSVVVDVGGGRVVRLNAKTNKDSLTSFAESQLRMKRGGCPVVEVFSQGKIGGQTAFVEVSFENKIVTLAEYINRMSEAPRGQPALLQQQQGYLRQEMVALGTDKIEAAFMEFVDKSAGFAVLDDVHPDNLVLIRRPDGSLEFKVWDTGTDEPNRTRWLNHDDLDNNRSFLDEEKMQLAFRGYIRPWLEKAKRRMMEGRQRIFPQLAHRIGSKDPCGGLGVL